MTDVLIFVDVETTGTYPHIHEVIEIGAIAVDARTLESLGVPDFHIRVLPEGPVNPSAAAVNGYTAAEWAETATDRMTAHDALTTWLGTWNHRYTLAGHNVPFDAAFLRAWGVASRRMLDTVSLAWPLWAAGELPGLKLDHLAEHFRISRPSPHRALDDARVSLEVARRLVGMGTP